MLMLPAMLCLLAGLDAALILLDLPAPMMISSWGQAHGLLLVFGFAGSLIALERAVALNKLAGYAAPLCLSLGGLAQLFTVPHVIPAGFVDRRFGGTAGGLHPGCGGASAPTR